MTWTTELRLLWARRLTAFGLLFGVLLSWKLWHTHRNYPLFPIGDFVPQFPQPFDLVFLFLFLATLVALIVRPNRRLVFALLLLSFILAVQDQSRWQPWFYQYVLMLLVFSLVKNQNQEDTALFMLQFIVAWIYIWSGIHKCQPKWIFVWEGYLIAPVTNTLEEGFLKSALHSAGRLIPAVEILMGACLFFNRTRFFAIVAILLSHSTILVLLGPVQGYISNSVVWPWNFTMMALVIVLFYKSEAVKLFPLFKGNLFIPRVCLVSLMCIAPILFYFGRWDRYLSFSLYAGQQRQMFVFIPAKTMPSIPKEWEPYLTGAVTKEGPRFLSPGKWSYSELNVPMISEWRILRAFSRKMCQQLDMEDHNLRFRADYRYPPKLTKRYFRCDQIEQMGKTTDP